jgi:hypothetical protein
MEDKGEEELEDEEVVIWDHFDEGEDHRGEVVYVVGCEDGTPVT